MSNQEEKEMSVREFLDYYFGEDQELYVFYQFKNLTEIKPEVRSNDGWLYGGPRINFSLNPTPPDDYLKYVYELDKDSIPDSVIIKCDEDKGLYYFETDRKIKIKRQVN